MTTRFLTAEKLAHLKTHLDTNQATMDTLNTSVSINDKISPLEDNIKMLKNRVTALEYELFEKEEKQKKKRISVYIKL